MVDESAIAVVHYTGRFAAGEHAGEVFDTSDVDVALETGVYEGQRDYRPIEFEVGGEDVIPAIDAAVREMDPGETRTVAVEPTDAYGPRSDDRVVDVPRDELEARSDAEAQPWRLVASENGEMGWITAVDEETVTVDFNHELADEPLEFEVRLLETREPEPEGSQSG